MTFPSPLAGEGDSPKASGVRGPAPQTLQTRARAMRHSPTEAEAVLWRLLRDRRLASHKFRRQQPIGSFIADFVCFEGRLVVEADGSHHADCARDGARTAWLEAEGFGVLRFWNSEIIGIGEAVLMTIVSRLRESPLTPLACGESPSPARGEGQGAWHD